LRLHCVHKEFVQSDHAARYAGFESEDLTDVVNDIVVTRGSWRQIDPISFLVHVRRKNTKCCVALPLVQ